MKRTIKILMLTLIVLALLIPMVKATTQNELQDYILGTHKIAGKDVCLTDENKGKVKKFFSNNTLTDDQATKIKAKIDEGIAFMDKAGVTDLSKLTTAQKKDLINLGKDAAAIAELTLVADSANNTIELYKDGVFIESISINPGILVQTGTTHYSYIIVPSVAIIAVAVTLVLRKKKANA